MSNNILTKWIEIQRARLDHLKEQVREIPIGMLPLPIRNAMESEAESLPAILIANGLTMERDGEQAGFPGTGKLVFRLIDSGAGGPIAKETVAKEAVAEPIRETYVIGPDDVGTLELGGPDAAT